MDTQVIGVVVLERKTGNFPLADCQFYTKDKPEIAVAADKRVSYLRFKTNKKTNTKRENFAVVVAKHDADNFSGVTGHKFLNDLIADFQDVCAAQVADGALALDVLGDAEKLIAEYNDNSRTSSGRKVTKETIAAFYDKYLAQVVATRALLKNAQMADETVAAVIKGYSEMFQKFTKYDLVNAFTPAQAELLGKLMEAMPEVSEEDSEMQEYLTTKHAKITKDRITQDNLADMI